MKVREDVSYDFFHRFDLFDGLDASELDKMADIVQYQVYETGETIVEENAESRDLFLLADGNVDIYKTDGGDPKFLAAIEAEAVLGELGMILGEPRSATAVANGEAHLLCVAGQPLIERRETGNIAVYKFEHNILRSLARRQSDMNTQLMEAMEQTEDSRFERDEVTDLREQLAENWSF